MSRQRAPRGPTRRRADARRVALDVIGRVRTTDAYANLVLPSAIRRAGLRPRDAALATELAYGTLRMLGTLDWIVSLHASRAPDPEVADVLRLGAYQLVYTDIPAHAAVAETVRLAPHRGRGFVNAVLRRVAGSDPPWPDPDDDPVAALALRHAHPEWIVRLWLHELGREHTEALLHSNNVAPAVTVRATTDGVADRLRGVGLHVEPGRWRADTLTVRGGGAPSSWPGFAEGAFVVQDEASVLAGATLGPEPGSTVADLCAGPGGKTSQLAATGARVVAVELHHGRGRLVAQAAPDALVVTGDATSPPLRGGLDGVLLDAPCSGLGVLRRRPEARWRVRPDDVDGAADLQRRLAASALDVLRPGGVLVYAVCTVTRAETTHVVDELLARAPVAAAEHIHPTVPRVLGEAPALQLLPHVHGTDGMFIARIRKA